MVNLCLIFGVQTTFREPTLVVIHNPLILVALFSRNVALGAKSLGVPRKWLHFVMVSLGTAVLIRVWTGVKRLYGVGNLVQLP